MASGANKLVLEVTCGKGAFMKTVESANKLSVIMKNLGKLANIETACLITNMDEPIGKCVRKFFRNRRSKRCIKIWKNGKRRKRNSIRNNITNLKTCRNR